MLLYVVPLAKRSMKKIFFLFLLMVCSLCRAQSPKEIAEILLARYEALADGSYKQLNKERIPSEGVTQYQEENFLGANRTDFTGYEDELRFTLTFFRNNPESVKTGKDMVKALKIIARNKGFQLISFDADSYILYKGAEKIMDYEHETYVDIYPNEYLHLNITAFTPYSHYLADETAYGNDLPTMISNTKKPQLLLVTDNGNNRSILMNGIFDRNKLVKGSFRIRGYGEFTDGTWLSLGWDPAGVSQVCFIPQGTADTVVGAMSNMNFSNFEANWSLYFDQSLKVPKIPSSAAPWLRDVYAPVYAERERRKQEKYENDHLYDNTLTYEQMLKQSENNRNNNSSQNNNSTQRTTPVHSSFSKCSVCNGKGYTEYDCAQGGGHPCRKYCSACNGTGQVHN